MVTRINTISAALDFLADKKVGDLDPAQLKFGKQLTGFGIVIQGANYHGTVPATLARGLWEFQEELYRAVAFALYGEDSIRRLTDEQKESFKLVFRVKVGSTDLFAPLEEFFKKLGEGFTTMDSKDKAKTLVAIVLIVAAAWGATHISDTLADVRGKEIAATAEVKSKEIAAATSAAQDTAKTEQFKLISDITRNNNVAARFEKATEEGAKAIIKSASDATKIKVGKVSFDRSDIVEVNQRAVKEKAEARVITGDFYVLRIEFRNPDSTRIWVATKHYDEFPLTILSSDLVKADFDKVMDAAQNRQPVQLEVNATLIRGQIRGAQIVQVL